MVQPDPKLPPPTNPIFEILIIWDLKYVKYLKILYEHLYLKGFDDSQLGPYTYIITFLIP